MEKRNFTVIVEGNIASGKTECLKYLNRSNDFSIIAEPVKRWQNVEDSGVNLLAQFYGDPQRWCLPFQSYVQLTMLQAHERAQAEPLAMMERSIFSARYCFVENLHRTKVMSNVEYHILDAWYRQMFKAIRADLVIYLRSRPEVSLERIRKRGRAGESVITLEYLRSLHELHEEWLMGDGRHLPSGCKVVVLDANQPLEEMYRVYDEEKEKVLSTARKRQKSVM